MIVVIDNYDSFTYNLVQYLGELGAEVRVFRNNEISVEAAAALHPTHIVISPGPGTPADAGVSNEHHPPAWDPHACPGRVSRPPVHG